MRTRCRDCGADLPNNHSGKCPKCGSEKKEIHVSVVDRMHLSDSVKFEAIKDFYRHNLVMHVLVIAFTLASSVIGYFISHPWGGLLGFLFGVLSYFLTPYATMRVREIRQG